MGASARDGAGGSEAWAIEKVSDGHVTPVDSNGDGFKAGLGAAIVNEADDAFKAEDAFKADDVFTGLLISAATLANSSRLKNMRARRANSAFSRAVFGTGRAFDGEDAKGDAEAAVLVVACLDSSRAMCGRPPPIRCR